MAAMESPVRKVIALAIRRITSACRMPTCRTTCCWPSPTLCASGASIHSTGWKTMTAPR